MWNLKSQRKGLMNNKVFKIKGAGRKASEKGIEGIQPL